MTSSIDLPHIVYVLPPYGSDPTVPSTTTIITPPPYPWSQTTKDHALNTRSTSWSSGSVSPTASPGSPGTGDLCSDFCDGPCLLCPPFWGKLSGGGGSSGSLNEDDDCSTKLARVCSTTCIAGSGYEFTCSTTTGCSATLLITKTVGTPPPGIAITREQWLVITVDLAAGVSITSSLDSLLSSLYSPLTVVSATTVTTVTLITSYSPSPTPTTLEMPTTLSVIGYSALKNLPAISGFANYWAARDYIISEPTTWPCLEPLQNAIRQPATVNVHAYPSS
jgi:hypothetical protein